MTAKQNKGYTLLRRKAEKKLREEGFSRIGQKQEKEQKELLHELRTHQLELEMQNLELRRAQEALEESSQKYADLYYYAPASYFTINRQGLIREANQTGIYQLLKKKKEFLVGLPLAKFVEKNDHGKYYEHLRKVFSSDTRQSCELRMKKDDGTAFTAHLESISVHGWGRGDNALVTLVDITYKKQMEEKLENLLIERTKKLADESSKKRELQEKNARLKTLSARLGESLKDKDILLQELNHRTKNNMNVILGLMNLQMNTIKDPGMKYLYKEVQNRIRSLALVHEMLYKTKDLSKLDLKLYLQELAGNALLSYKEARDIRLKFDMDPLPVSLYLATPCGLVLNELISNSVKHAFPGVRRGVITISLKAEGPRVLLTYSDNGVGLPEGFDIARASALGLRLVDGLVRKQLLGELAINGTKGTKITVSFNKDYADTKKG